MFRGTRHLPEAEDEVVDEREAARRRVRDRRDFSSNLVAFVVINGALIAIWAVSGGGYFWPAWVIALWGIGLLLHAWNSFVRKPVTEADVDSEMRRHRRA